MWVELCVSSATTLHEGGPPRRYGMSIGVLQANDLGGTSQDFVCLRLLMCALGCHRSVGLPEARTGTYCSGSGGFCVTKTLTSTRKPHLQARAGYAPGRRCACRTMPKTLRNSAQREFEDDVKRKRWTGAERPMNLDISFMAELFGRSGRGEIGSVKTCPVFGQHEPP